MEYTKIKQELIDRLESLGYAFDADKDEFLLRFCFDKVQENILNITNQSAIPSGLHFNLVDWVCGEFLYTANSLGMLSDEQKQGVVKQISMGDVSVSYDEESTPQAKYGVLIDGMRLNKNTLIRYRKMVW